MAGADDLLDFEQDAIVWISDPEAVWLPGKVTKITDADLKVDVGTPDDPGGVRSFTIPRPGSDVPLGRKGTAAPQRLLRRNVALQGEGALEFSDLTGVPELHEAAVLHALNVRFLKGVVYTLSGPVLLAVNPFRTLPGLYSPETLQSFVGKEKLAPHIFSVANHAYQGICRRNASQSVLITGESGAGKTETTKFVMQFLALAGVETTGTVERSKASALSRVERQVLGSNALLEAFGNAKTLRNDNSSRFGKYTELQFGAEDDDPRGGAPRLVGVRIRTYLLEKVRVTEQKDGERNYHIFYQALAAARAAKPSCLPTRGGAQRKNSEALSPRARTASMASEGRAAESPNKKVDEEGNERIDLDDLYGYSASSFAYLRKSVGAPYSGNDSEEFEMTLSAMRTVGFSMAGISDVLRAVAAVLHLGDVEFAKPPQNSEASQVLRGEDGEPQPFEAASRLLGVPMEEFEQAICCRTMVAEGRSISMTNNVSQAAESRDALARALYYSVFEYVVLQTNRSIGFRDETTFCGVLDIFGFEFFKHNSFEQLCINFTNELLQQYFNSFIFENETALYRNEGVPWDPQDFPSNAAIVIMLQQSPQGVFPMLDEECFLVGGSTTGWRQKLVKTHDGHKNFSIVLTNQGTFVIHHFAGPVTYTAEGFMEKNRDRLSADVVNCLKSRSSSAFVSERFDSHAKRFGGSVEPQKSGKVMKAQRYSVSSEFRQQLTDLMTQVRTTEPHFVRCIKPNPFNKPYVDASVAKPVPCLERTAVAEQLSYQGVLEAIRVARAGYPVRFLHEDFFADFRHIVERDLRKELEAEAGTAGKKRDVTPSIVLKILESPKLSALIPPPEREGATNWAIGKTLVFLKQGPFGVLKVAQGKLRQHSAVRIQAKHRWRRACAVARSRQRSLLIFQSLARGWAARRDVAERRRVAAATMIAKNLLSLLARDRMRKARLAVEFAQRWARMRPCRSHLVQCRASAKRLQTWRRGLVQRRRWRNLPIAMLKIQRVYRGHIGRVHAQNTRVSLFRLHRVCRVLLRIRRKNAAHREWRRQILQAYKKPKLPAAPPEDVLMKEYLRLEKHLRERKDAVFRLKAECESLEMRISTAKKSSWA